MIEIRGCRRLNQPATLHQNKKQKPFITMHSKVSPLTIHDNVLAMGLPQDVQSCQNTIHTNRCVHNRPERKSTRTPSPLSVSSCIDRYEWCNTEFAMPRQQLDRLEARDPVKVDQIFRRFRCDRNNKRLHVQDPRGSITSLRGKYSHLSPHTRDLLLDNEECLQNELQRMKESLEEDGSETSDFDVSDDLGLAIKHDHTPTLFLTLSSGDAAAESCPRAIR
jgi:hypothetical protein